MLAFSSPQKTNNHTKTSSGLKKQNVSPGKLLNIPAFCPVKRLGHRNQRATPEGSASPFCFATGQFKIKRNRKQSQHHVASSGFPTPHSVRSEDSRPAAGEHIDGAVFERSPGAAEARSLMRPLHTSHGRGLARVSASLQQRRPAMSPLFMDTGCDLNSPSSVSAEGSNTAGSVSGLLVLRVSRSMTSNLS